MPTNDLHWITEPALYRQADGREWWDVGDTKQAMLFRRRSDGEMFFVGISISKDTDATPAIAEAAERLGTFEKCTCVAGSPCQDHETMIGAVKEGGRLPEPQVKS